MPKLQQTVEPEATIEVELSPELRAQFLQELRIYEGLKAEADDANRDLAASKGLLESMREDVGAKRLRLPGDYGITRVDGGTSSSLSKKKVYALGITKAQLDACYTKKPKKPHTLVILPGDEEKAAKAKAHAPRDERDEEDRDE